MCDGCLWCCDLCCLLVMLWCWHQTVYLQPAITNWYFDTISHRTLSMWARGDNRIHGNMSWELDWRHETPVTSIWMTGLETWDTSDIHLNAGLSSESESPSCTDHTRPPLSSQCVQHSNFRREGGGGVSKGCGERAIVVTFFSNKNCIIAEWAGAALRRGNEGSLWETWTGFVARRKTLLMCWLKTSPQNSAGKTYSKSIYHEERSSVFV